ncbi:MAG: response regulator [Pseudomonadales bacterium]
MAAHILVVDDELAVRRVVGDLLGRLGYLPTCVDSAAEALLACTRQSFRLALVDLSMPGVSGAELVARLRERYSGLPIVVMTGLDRVTAQAQLGSGDSPPVLRKPFSLSELGAVVESLIA